LRRKPLSGLPGATTYSLFSPAGRRWPVGPDEGGEAIHSEPAARIASPLPYKADPSAAVNGLAQKTVRRFWQRRFLDRRCPILPLKHLAKGRNFGCDVLVEHRPNFLEKGFVLGLGLGNANFDVRPVAGAFRERVGHQDLRGIGHRHQRGQRQQVERAPVEHFLDHRIFSMHAMIDGANPAAAMGDRFAHLVSGPPFGPETRRREIVPDGRARCRYLEFDHHRRLVARHFMALPVVFRLPCLFEIPHPACHVADDVDLLPVFDETLSDWIDVHRPDTRIGIERVGVSMQPFVHRILEKAMNEDDISTGQFLAAGHLLPDELAMMADEFEVQLLHVGAGKALAGGRLLDIAQPPAESEVCGLDGVLKQRSVDPVGDRVDKNSIALEFGKSERRPQGPHHRVHQVGYDILGVVEFDTCEKAGIAGDIGDGETGGF
jgi:hypothetical protein